jgi:hypothetical protein
MLGYRSAFSRVSPRFSLRSSVTGVGAAYVLLGLTACSEPVYQAISLDNPLDQSAYLWPDTAVAQVATGAKSSTPPVVFTVRTSEWLNTPEEASALIARTCGPAYHAAQVYRHDGAGSLLHPVELQVHCGEAAPRVAVYPEPGTGLSENLAAMTTVSSSPETPTRVHWDSSGLGAVGH